VVVGAVGTVIGVILVLLLIVLPSAEDDCGPGRYLAPPDAGNCAGTGLPEETGLDPDALRVLRCIAAHFGVRDFVGRSAGVVGDHATGRAVDILLDGRGTDPAWDTGDGRAKGDEIVAYLRENAAAFHIDYVIWRQRTWNPDPTGKGPGAWQPFADRGDPAADRMDRIQVTTKAVAPVAADAGLAEGIDGVAAPQASGAGVNDGGGLIPTGSRHVPIAGPIVISDGFGARGGEHQGVDFAAPAGTPILAAAAGKVVAAGPASGFGNWIVIDSLDANGTPFSTVYGHMDDGGLLVHAGQPVAAGQHIADVGSAGEATGPHLHFELVPGGRLTGGQAIDPIPWLQGAPITGATGISPGDVECYNGFGTAGGDLAMGKVPPELAMWYRRAGSLCPEITPSLLAAQGKQESGFQRGLTSSSGAEGLAQFMPGTAAAIDPDDGQPYVIDADGAGMASPWDDADAIIGQGRYMCHLAKQIEEWKAEGKVSGDTVALSLAAYNAGLGAVLESGGMPDLVPDHFTQTQPYVANILGMEPAFRAPGGFGEFVPAAGGDTGRQVLGAGTQWLGVPYVFGGGGPQGPTGGGFDMPGLTAAAVAAATGGAVSLPRTAEEQWGRGVEVPMGQAQAGDLVFGGFGVSGPSEVGIYAGDGTMIIAESGGRVGKAPVTMDMRARRIR
jgi:hypothetical protein